jgi:putative transcription factor
MEECEICGKKSSDIYIVNVEEVELRVCTKCAKEARRMVGATPKKNDFDQLIDNYGEVIRNARESMKMPIKVLAELISEKESHLLHIEQQKTRPSEELRKKLEKELGIRLVEPAAGQDEKGGRGGGDGATLGDFVIKKK